MNDQPLNFCAFVMNTPSHIIHGLWRDPEGDQIRFNELDLWIDLAQRLEAGGFDAAFFADVIGLYPRLPRRPRVPRGARPADPLQRPDGDHLGARRGDREPRPRRHPRLRPVAALPVRPPDGDARPRDQAGGSPGTSSPGRTRTAGATSAGRGCPPTTPATRSPTSTSKSSTSCGRGRGTRTRCSPTASRGLHADPSKIHPINHVGEHFKCEGPFLVTPSPQRTPLLFQAGSSPVGRDFCARHAEAQFIQSPSPEDARKQISETRDLLEKHGRTREEIKFFQGLSFVVGSTEEEALRNERELEEKIDVDGDGRPHGRRDRRRPRRPRPRRHARRGLDRRRPGHPPAGCARAPAAATRRCAT